MLCVGVGRLASISELVQGIIISTGDVEKLNDEQQELSTDYKPLGPDGDTATLLVRFQLQVRLAADLSSWLLVARPMTPSLRSAHALAHVCRARP
jgi:hypothetical protein